MFQVLCVCALLLYSGSCNTDGNHLYGNDFYLGALRNYNRQTTKLWLMVSTNATNDTVAFTVEALRFASSGNVSSQQPARIDLPLELVVEDYSYLHRAKGIHVFTLNKTHFISVVLFNWEDGSVGDYVSLPCPLNLPPDQSNFQYAYYSLSTRSYNPETWSQTLIVGCQDDTVITVVPSLEFLIPIIPQDSFSPPVVVLPGQEHSFTLNAGETLLLGKSNGDISGTEIRSNKPLTVVSGHECGNVPSDVQWCEHLTVQIPPAYTWGNEFLLVPFKSRDSGQYFKVLAKHEFTAISVSCNGTQIENFELQGKGTHESFFVNSSTYCYLLASKPVLLVQLALGAELDSVGDPIIIIQPPTQQYTSSIIFEVLEKEQFAMSYVNIVARNVDIIYDDVPLDGVSWVPIHGLSSDVVGYGCTLEVEPGLHTIYHKSEVFSAMLYGFHALPYRGYGHVLGNQLNLLSENPFVSFERQEYSVQENHTNVVVGIHCRASFSTNFSVIAKTIPSESNDFQPLNAVVTCQQGESYQEVYISIVDDNLVEPVENFMIVLVPAAGSNEFYSQNNVTVISIVDNDSIEMGIIDTEPSGQNVKVTLGTITGELQEDAIVELVLTLQIISNDAVCGAAVYHTTITYQVPNVQIKFNLMRILTAPNKLSPSHNFVAVVALSTQQTSIHISLRRLATEMTIVLPSVTTLSDAIFHNLTSEMTPATSSLSFSKKTVAPNSTTGFEQDCPSLAMTTDYQQVADGGPLSGNSAIVILASAGGAFIILIAILLAVFVIILLKKMPKQRPPVPGIANPYHISTSPDTHNPPAPFYDSIKS